MAEEEQPKMPSPSPSPSGENSISKKIKGVLSSASCLVPSAEVKEEEPVHGAVAQGSGGGAAVAEQANDQELERPRINISVDVQLLHCAVAECHRALKPPVVKCEAGHLLCDACLAGGHCRKCDRATAFAHCGPELDLFVGDARVPCPFRAYGCGASVVYHATAAHQDACAYAPCHCAVPGCPFTAAPPRLRDHLAADHAWPLDTLPAYGRALPLRVPASESESEGPAAAAPHHRLLVVRGDERSLFALSVRPCGAASRAVSVSCVRTSAAAEAGPRFTYVLWARSPAAAAGTGMAPASAGRRLMLEADVASCAVPGGAAVEDGMALYVPPPMLHGPSKEMHLRIRIDMVDAAPAPQLSVSPCSPRV